MLSIGEQSFPETTSSFSICNCVPSESYVVGNFEMFFGEHPWHRYRLRHRFIRRRKLLQQFRIACLAPNFLPFVAGDPYNANMQPGRRTVINSRFIGVALYIAREIFLSTGCSFKASFTGLYNAVPTATAANSNHNMYFFMFKSLRS